MCSGLAFVAVRWVNPSADAGSIVEWSPVEYYDGTSVWSRKRQVVPLRVQFPQLPVPRVRLSVAMRGCRRLLLADGFCRDQEARRGQDKVKPTHTSAVHGRKPSPSSPHSPRQRSQQYPATCTNAMSEQATRPRAAGQHDSFFNPPPNRASGPWRRNRGWRGGPKVVKRPCHSRMG